MQSLTKLPYITLLYIILLYVFFSIDFSSQIHTYFKKYLYFIIKIPFFKKNLKIIFKRKGKKSPPLEKAFQKC